MSDITEFTWLDPEELHLVDAAATKYSPLLAKNADGGTKAMAKLQKKLRKALAVDLSGGASTASDRQSAADLDRMVHAAGRQTRGLSGDGGRALRQVLKQADNRVVDRQADLAAAANDFDTMRARAALSDAFRARYMLKMVVKENAHEHGLPRSHMGPGWTDLFGGSTHSLGHDPAIRGWNGSAPDGGI